MHKLVNNFDFHLSTEDVLKGQGIDPTRASSRLFEIAHSVIDEAKSLLKPAALYTVVNITKFEHQQIFFEGGAFEGPLVARAMAGADQLNIAICTIGEELDDRVSTIMDDDPVTAIALDGAGISAICIVAQTIEDLINVEACKLDLTLGMRVQPGQEGWPIEQQAQVFTTLPADQIGMRLTESCLMIPRKSESFVIPRGKDLNSSIVPCDFCSKRNRCEWKKDKQIR